MKSKFLIFLALLGSLPWTAPAETVIKILHVIKFPKVQAIWAAAGQEYEKTHPGIKVEFYYLKMRHLKPSCPRFSSRKIGQVLSIAGVAE